MPEKKLYSRGDGAFSGKLDPSRVAPSMDEAYALVRGILPNPPLVGKWQAQHMPRARNLGIMSHFSAL